MSEAGIHRGPIGIWKRQVLIRAAVLVETTECDPTEDVGAEPLLNVLVLEDLLPSGAQSATDLPVTALPNHRRRRLDTHYPVLLPLDERRSPLVAGDENIVAAQRDLTGVAVAEPELGGAARRCARGPAGRRAGPRRSRARARARFSGAAGSRTRRCRLPRTRFEGPGSRRRWPRQVGS
jgi:hypothetical protein